MQRALDAKEKWAAAKQVRVAPEKTVDPAECPTKPGAPAWSCAVG